LDVFKGLQGNKFINKPIQDRAMKIECSQCNYVMDKPSIPGRCPYCGKKGSMIKAKEAQDILNDADY